MKNLCIILLATVIFSSCSNFYKAVTTIGHSNAADLEELKRQQKYFILRDNSMAYGMTNISVNPDGKSVQCDLVSLPDQHLTHASKAVADKPKYDKVYADYIFNEVHIYTNPDSSRAPGHYTLPFSDVLKTEVLQKDTVRTRRNHIRSVLLGVGGTVVVVGAIGAIALSNLTFSLY